MPDEADWRLGAAAIAGSAVLWLIFDRIFGVPCRVACGCEIKDERDPPRLAGAEPQATRFPRRYSRDLGTLACALPAFRRRSPWRCCCPSPMPMAPSAPVVMLAGVYVGAEYGGSIPRSDPHAGH